MAFVPPGSLPFAGAKGGEIVVGRGRTPRVASRLTIGPLTRQLARDHLG